MFIFRFFTIFFSINIPFMKMYYMPQNAIFQAKENPSFFTSFQENKPKSNYDIRLWVQQLCLQKCAFVEIGEGFCALFVELETGSIRITEFFLGICDCYTLRSWKLCSPELFDMRKSDCIFTEATATANTSARVHRRLCDITFLSSFAPICNCTIPLAGQELSRTEGSSFPTCFLNPLPESICSPRGVCGVARCTVKTIMGIHSPRCDPNCHQRQPFCEDLGPWTSVSSKVTSSWSNWSNPKCNVACGRGFLSSTATCYNQDYFFRFRGEKGLDCIGPGTLCCPYTSKMCKCKVMVANGVMEANRLTEPCISSDFCSLVTTNRIHLKSQISDNDEWRNDKNDDINEEREEFDLENSKGETLLEASNEYEESLRLFHRRLLGNFYYDMYNYGVMKEDNDKEFERDINDERISEIDDNNDDDVEYDPDMENVDNEPEESEEDEDENEEVDGGEDEDDMIIFKKGGKVQNKKNRVLRSDDEATFNRESRALGFPNRRKNIPKKNYDCEEPTATDLPLYREYDSENEDAENLSKVEAKSQLLILVLAFIIASFMIPFG